MVAAGNADAAMKFVYTRSKVLASGCNFGVRLPGIVIFPGLGYWVPGSRTEALVVGEPLHGILEQIVECAKFGIVSFEKRLVDVFKMPINRRSPLAFSTGDRYSVSGTRRWWF